MMALVEELRKKWGTPAAVFARLGLDSSLIEEAKMAYRHHEDRARDYGRRDEAEDRHRHVRDALRRAADAELDDPEAIEELLEELAEAHPEVVGRVAREIGEDRHGPHHWARDRREVRMSRDALHHRRARDVGRRPHLVRDFGPPGVGREEGSPRIEEFPGSRNWEEGLDRRRAMDMAYDSGGSGLAAAVRLFGPRFAQIETR
jgi:hypothetical protein